MEMNSIQTISSFRHRLHVPIHNRNGAFSKRSSVLKPFLKVSIFLSQNVKNFDPWSPKRWEFWSLIPQKHYWSRSHGLWSQIPGLWSLIQPLKSRWSLIPYTSLRPWIKVEPNSFVQFECVCIPISTISHSGIAWIFRARKSLPPSPKVRKCSYAYANFVIPYIFHRPLLTCSS